VADFKFASARDRAVLKGFIHIGGVALPIRPWRSAGGAETTWWFHVKLTLENVPLEVWNEDDIMLILGDTCIFDRFDSLTASTDRETSQLLTCWVWIENPGMIPRAVEYWLFVARARQAMELVDLPSPIQILSTPPVGKFREKVILIHLAGYEDWSPQTPRSSSFVTSSEHDSSAPLFIPFIWAAGVLDSHPPHVRPTLSRNGGSCRATANGQPCHD
jgi:hypothetical protein